MELSISIHEGKGKERLDQILDSCRYCVAAPVHVSKRFYVMCDQYHGQSLNKNRRSILVIITEKITRDESQIKSGKTTT